MKQLYLIFVILCLAGIFFSCNKASDALQDTPCSTSILTADLKFDSTKILVDSAVNGLTYYPWGDSTMVYVTLHVPNICGNSEPTVTWTTNIIYKNNPSFTVYFTADWYISLGYRIKAHVFQYTSPLYEYTSQYNIGLTQVYPDKAGEIYANIEYVFPKKGTRAKDLEFLRSSIGYSVIHIPYYPFKQ